MLVVQLGPYSCTTASCQAKRYRHDCKGFVLQLYWSAMEVGTPSTPVTYDESVVQLYPTGVLVPKTVLGRKTCRWIGTSKTGGDSKLKTGEDFVPSFGLACG